MNRQYSVYSEQNKQKRPEDTMGTFNKMENGNWEWVKETTTRPKRRKQSKSINGSSMQREIFHFCTRTLNNKFMNFVYKCLLSYS